jgi:Protein of unknown function (DUF3223)
VSEFFTSNKFFPTKAAAIEHFREMLHRYNIGDRISDTDAAELAALLERHPTYEQKRGVGIACFTIISAPHNCRAFYITHVDGTSTDFSYRKCIESHPTAREQLHKALRREVGPDIALARLKFFQKNANKEGCVPCALTGALIDIGGAHADHAPPFTFFALAEAFLRARKVDPAKDLLSPPADNQIGRTLCDRALAHDWRVFHHQLANLRIVAADENIRRAKMAMPRAIDRQLVLET